MQKDSLERLHINELNQFDSQCEQVIEEYISQAMSTQQEIMERHQR